MRSRFVFFALADKSGKIIEVNREFEDFEDSIGSGIGVIFVS
jgi:hypothetical protein